MLAEELFAKALQSSETCIIVNNNPCRRLFSSVNLQHHLKNFKVTSVLPFTPYFDLLSCELDNFTFKILHWVLFWYYIKIK